MAAAREIEAHGYHGTDTNRIARTAGYSPGTFYKHFADKREVFIAVYDEWVTTEWARLSEIASGGGTRAEIAGALADAVIDHHKTWPGFRASLRALVALDPVVRAANRAGRKRQLEVMRKVTPRPDPIVLLVVERIADALADGEAAALGLREDEAREYLASCIAGTLT